MEIRRLTNDSVTLIAEIDRSECVDYAYRVREGALERYAVEWDIPTFRKEGVGPHTVADQIKHRGEALAAGGVLLAAFDIEVLAGLAVVDPAFEPPMAWLAYMQVSRPYRRKGVGRLLWDEAESIARAAGATSIYVSAVPSGPTVDFYTGCGCRLVETPHPRLFGAEPEDIHLIKQFD